MMVLMMVQTHTFQRACVCVCVCMTVVILLSPFTSHQIAYSRDSVLKPISVVLRHTSVKKEKPALENYNSIHG